METNKSNKSNKINSNVVDDEWEKFISVDYNDASTDDDDYDNDNNNNEEDFTNRRQNSVDFEMNKNLISPKANNIYISTK